jgi:hypothetical protein
MEALCELMTTRLDGWVRCFLNLWLRWADLRLVDGGFVGRRCGWIFIASTAFFFFFVMVAAGEVGVIGKDWLAGEGHGADKLLIFLMYSLFLLNFSFHVRNSYRVFSCLACCSTLKKIWKDMVMAMDR